MFRVYFIYFNFVSFRNRLVEGQSPTVYFYYVKLLKCLDRSASAYDLARSSIAGELYKPVYPFSRPI